MRVSDLIQSRQRNWQELQHRCSELEGASGRRVPAEAAARFAALYRAACADLALADAYHLPPATVQYLHQLVGKAHNQLYRTQAFAVAKWRRELLVNVPRRLYRDASLRLALAIFWGVFLLSAAMAFSSPDYADRVLGKDLMMGLEEMYSRPVAGRGDGATAVMATGFYAFHNPSIGLRCFAFGLVFGIGGLFPLVYNASILGAAFGHMAGSPNAGNFFHFVTAHGPFELTAIALAAAAGMRLGFSLVSTGGYTRTAALRRAASEALPSACTAVLLFLLAAVIEGFLSPSPAPYWVKLAVAITSCVMLAFYFIGLGRRAVA
ncbi:MAG: stage II sporulation protein M [Thermoguttaceae bacterium]|jgi:uncharacterized membrane protein SpoIIM required for sporulation|nr:stage II sporulation protein M [Thermoguttaceae bacterium]